MRKDLLLPSRLVLRGYKCIPPPSVLKFTLRRPNGTIFQIDISETPVKIKKGDIVEFSYVRHARQSAPTHPTILRIRKDVTWEEVLRNWDEKTSETNSVLMFNNVIFTMILGAHRSLSKGAGRWTPENRANARIFFENFAKSRNFDPYVAENWYTVLGSLVRQEVSIALCSTYLMWLSSKVKAYWLTTTEV